jgi:CRISPR-associated RAMP protein (TIGR02581 family)
MLKALLNEAHVRLNITTLGPLLIKTGYATVIGADMAPVQTYRHGQSKVYLPGSSLKGVFRSHIEKVVNSIHPRVACNPLMQKENGQDIRHLYRPSCAAGFTPTTPAHKVYADSCPTCRLFGSTSFIGRITVEDAYLPEGTFEERKLIEYRDGIAIDRLTGGTGGAKFDLETVTAGTTFTTNLHLRNFEIWQLGMLFVILQDMEDQLLHLGSGRSRGLGKVEATLDLKATGPYTGGIVLTTTRLGQSSKEPDNELWGLGRWLKEGGERPETYGTDPGDLITLPASVLHTPRGVRAIRVIKGQQEIEDLKNKSVDVFLERMSAWKSAPLPVQSRG